MKKSCDGCKAFRMDRCDSYCDLGYNIDSIKWKPLEQCPKPRTYMELINSAHKTIKTTIINK